MSESLSDQIGSTATSDLERRLQMTLEETARKRRLEGAVAHIERAGDHLAWTGTVGELTTSTPFFIASTTKLFTTAVVLRLAERGALDLEDRLVDLLDRALVAGLHVLSRVDHTAEITVNHLLAHTSGLPDYFMGKDGSGGSLERSLRRGDDRSWTLEDVLAWSRRLGPRFRPGTPGKAHYSDTNFQLLGRIVEQATGRSYGEAVQYEVMAPLGLRQTWLYTDPSDARPTPLRDGGRRLDIPLAMTSFGPDGGIVSTVDDLARFLRGFFEGHLFDGSVMPSLKRYNRILFPLHYGVGFARLKLPRILSPFAAQPELIGHSGLSGAFAFLAPERGVYLAGTVNDLSRPDTSFRLMLRLLSDLHRAS